MIKKIIRKLELKSANLRIKTFNAFISTGEAHLGGSFSMMESLVVLFELIIKKKRQVYTKQVSFLLSIVFNFKRKRI